MKLWHLSLSTYKSTDNLLSSNQITLDIPKIDIIVIKKAGDHSFKPL